MEVKIANFFHFIDKWVSACHSDSAEKIQGGRGGTLMPKKKKKKKNKKEKC